jgi:MoxR-like ATPase
MEEQQVTVDGQPRKVPIPFFVIATQNPIEYQGTFPLPEAQMDRFTLSLSLGYPSEAEELQMLQRQQAKTLGDINDLEPCISLEEVLELQHLASQVKVTTALQQYMLDLVRASREDDEIALGVSPRGTVALQRASQAYALIQQRDYATPDDVKFLAPHVLSHRLIPSGGKQARTIVDRLLRTISVE